MPKKIYILVYALYGFLIVGRAHAQEVPVPEPNNDTELEIEESAEVFLDAYSDDFQENFFEALKQKGIENYDKSINALLKCKQLDASDPVVDHELAKVYAASRKYPQAEDYALTALKAQPENLWYAETLITVLQNQGKSIESLVSELPFNQPEFSKNLASLYLKKGNYETALTIIRKADQNRITKAMATKIEDSIQKRETFKKAARAVKDGSGSANSRPRPETGTTSGLNSADSEISEPNPLEVYKTRLQALMQTDSVSVLNKLSEEALESYPAQPYFYFAQGVALNKMGLNEEAVETLETALDYLIDDTSLENSIYQALADTYTALNDAVKANMYLRKIKPGF